MAREDKPTPELRVVLEQEATVKDWQDLTTRTVPKAIVSSADPTEYSQLIHDFPKSVPLFLEMIFDEPSTPRFDWKENFSTTREKLAKFARLGPWMLLPFRCELAAPCTLDDTVDWSDEIATGSTPARFPRTGNFFGVSFDKEPEKKVNKAEEKDGYDFSGPRTWNCTSWTPKELYKDNVYREVKWSSNWNGYLERYSLLPMGAPIVDRELSKWADGASYKPEEFFQNYLRTRIKSKFKLVTNQPFGFSVMSQTMPPEYARMIEDKDWWGGVIDPARVIYMAQPKVPSTEVTWFTKSNQEILKAVIRFGSGIGVDFYQIATKKVEDNNGEERTIQEYVKINSASMPLRRGQIYDNAYATPVDLIFYPLAGRIYIIEGNPSPENLPRPEDVQEVAIGELRLPPLQETTGDNKTIESEDCYLEIANYGAKQLFRFMPLSHARAGLLLPPPLETRSKTSDYIKAWMNLSYVGKKSIVYDGEQFPDAPYNKIEFPHEKDEDGEFQYLERCSFDVLYASSEGHATGTRDEENRKADEEAIDTWFETDSDRLQIKWALRFFATGEAVSDVTESAQSYDNAKEGLEEITAKYEDLKSAYEKNEPPTHWDQPPTSGEVTNAQRRVEQAQKTFDQAKQDLADTAGEYLKMLSEDDDIDDWTHKVFLAWRLKQCVSPAINQLTFEIFYVPHSITVQNAGEIQAVTESATVTEGLEEITAKVVASLRTPGSEELIGKIKSQISGTKPIRIEGKGYEENTTRLIFKGFTNSRSFVRNSPGANEQITFNCVSAMQRAKEQYAIKCLPIFDGW